MRCKYLLLILPSASLILFSNLYCFKQKKCPTKLAKFLSFDYSRSSEEVRTDYSQLVQSFHENRSSTRPAKVNYSLNADLVIGIISSYRNYPENWEWFQSYVSLTVAQVLKQIINTTLTDVFICQVDSTPQLTRNVQPWQNFVKIIQRSSTELAKNRFEKEKLDYVFCLESAQRQWPNTRAIVLLEDDAVPLDTFVHTLYKLMYQIQYPLRLYSESRELAYVKLYHPTRLRKIPWIIQSFAFSAFATFSLTLGLLYTFQFKFSNFYIVYIFVCILLSCFVVGHSGVTSLIYLFRSILSLNQPYMVPSESCCTQAVLYPSQNISNVIAFFKSQTCSEKYAKDHVLDQLPYSTGLTGSMTYHNHVRHTGRYSSLRNKPVITD